LSRRITSSSSSSRCNCKNTKFSRGYFWISFLTKREDQPNSLTTKNSLDSLWWAQGQINIFYPSGLDLPFSLSRSGAWLTVDVVGLLVDVVRLLVSDAVNDFPWDVVVDAVIEDEETTADGFIRNTSPNDTTSISSSKN
jgi:hypothetical protein